jgi:hypothetical protein
VIRARRLVALVEEGFAASLTEAATRFALSHLAMGNRRARSQVENILADRMGQTEVHLARSRAACRTLAVKFSFVVQLPWIKQNCAIPANARRKAPLSKPLYLRKAQQWSGLPCYKSPESSPHLSWHSPWLPLRERKFLI